MGIINFQGKRDKKICKPTSQILVSDYMTKKLITFSPGDSLSHVINLLIKNKISGGPVVNDKNELIPIDCNLRAGGSAISSIFLKKVIKINLLELDYLSLTGERPLRIGKLNGYGAIFYYSSINKKIKKNKLSKNCYHENLKGNDTKNKNNDLGRKSLIIIENSKKEKFFKEFKDVFIISLSSIFSFLEPIISNPI